MENNTKSIEFVSGDHYWDYVPGGQFVAPNGWIVRCLLTAEELKNQGVSLDICLANIGTLAHYHHECSRGSIVIFAVSTPHGVTTSTAEFRLSMRGTGPADCGVCLELLQHTQLKNQIPILADVQAIDALRTTFLTPSWQAHALEGLRLSSRRDAFRREKNEMSVALSLVGIQTFVAVFGEARADDLQQQFLVRQNQISK